MSFWRRIAFGALLGGLIVLFSFPLVWMISYSLRPIGQPPPSQLEFFPWPWAFGNYARVDHYLPLARYLWNSFKVVGLAVPLTLLTASWAGFALAQLPRRAQGLVFALSVALLLVPGPAVWVPRFILYAQLGLTESILPLIVPALMGTSPFYVLLFFYAFARVPGELYESARLDGAGPLRTWWSIGLPLARPAVVAVAVLAFAAYWSNYIDPLLYLRSPADFTLPVGIQLLQQAQKSTYPVLMAASVLLVAPVVALFALAQRFFILAPPGPGSPPGERRAWWRLR